MDQSYSHRALNKDLQLEYKIHIYFYGEVWNRK